MQLVRIAIATIALAAVADAAAAQGYGRGYQARDYDRGYQGYGYPGQHRRDPNALDYWTQRQLELDLARTARREAEQRRFDEQMQRHIEQVERSNRH